MADEYATWGGSNLVTAQELATAIRAPETGDLHDIARWPELAAAAGIRAPRDVLQCPDGR